MPPRILREEFCKYHDKECTMDEDGTHYQPVYHSGVDGYVAGCDDGLYKAVKTSTKYTCDTSGGYWIYGPAGDMCSTICPDHVDTSNLDIDVPQYSIEREHIMTYKQLQAYAEKQDGKFTWVNHPQWKYVYIPAGMTEEDAYYYTTLREATVKIKKVQQA